MDIIPHINDYIEEICNKFNAVLTEVDSDEDSPPKLEDTLPLNYRIQNMIGQTV